MSLWEHELLLLVKVPKSVDCLAPLKLQNQGAFATVCRTHMKSWTKLRSKFKFAESSKTNQAAYIKKNPQKNNLDDTINTRRWCYGHSQSSPLCDVSVLSYGSHCAVDCSSHCSTLIVPLTVYRPHCHALGLLWMYICSCIVFCLFYPLHCHFAVLSVGSRRHAACATSTLLRTSCHHGWISYTVRWGLTFFFGGKWLRVVSPVRDWTTNSSGKYLLTLPSE